MKMRVMTCLSVRYWLCLACVAIAETFAFAADIGLNERFQTAVESQLARYRKAIVDDDIAHGEFTFDVRRLTYDFSRQFLPTDILSPNQTADSVTLAKELPGVAVGQLAFTATDGTHHIFSSWIAERIQRPLAWMADGYPVQPSADLSGLTNFIGRVLLAAQSGSQHTLKVSATPVGRTAVVKSAFFGKKYEVPFDRAFVAFIDDNPSANWGHAARLVFVKDDLSAFEVWFINEPLKVEVDSRAFDLMPVYQDVDDGPMPTLDEIRQSVVPSNAIELQNGVSVDGDVSHSYAILISGGGDRGNNHTRYWGDMAAVYGTLTLTYKMPKTNIIVCMSDGTSPDADVSYGTSSSQSHGLFPDNSSPLDLDGDGEADVDYSATQTSVKSAFASMRNKLTASDQLFVFITDHGLQDPESGLCKLVLWDKYFMSPSELAGLTSDLPCPVLFAFEFCYSGAFISALKAQSGGRAIATAASETTSSGWNKTSKVSGVTSAQGSNYMNPWVYYFVGAMRGIVPHVSIEPWGNGNYLCTGADASNDGWVSIKEASDYAKSKIKADGYPEEPNYDDSPNGIGNDLCLIKKSASLPTIPSAPTVRISGTTLSWDPVYGAKYYKVYRATTPYDDPVEYKTWQTGTSCQIEKPSAEGTAYFWFVKAASEKDDATAGPFNAFKVVTGNSDYTLLQYTSDRNYTVYNDDAEFHLLGSAASTVTPYDASSCMQTAGGNLKFTSTKSGSGITVTANGTDLATSPLIANSFLGKWTLKIVATANTTATPRSYSFYSNATVPSGWSSTTGGTYGQHRLFWIARPHYIYQAPGKPNFSIGTTKLDVAAEGGACSVSITLSANRTTWTASASKDWIRLYRQGSTGSAVLGFVVEKNETGSARTAVVTIDDGWGDAKTLTVTQAGSVTVSLSSISISGESTVTSGGNTTYTCTATMSDGTTKAVTPTWSIYSGSSYASISTSGKLTANTVTSSQSVTVKASYTEGGVTKTATKSVTINPPAVSLSSISINGPDYVYAGKTGNFAASATMSDGTTKSITPTWSIYSGTSYASISTAGVLTGKTVTSTQSVTVKASYTEGGVTKTATKTVTVYPTFTLATALDNSTLTFTTGGNADWFGQGKTTYDGTDAARSGIITHNQNSWMETTVTGPGTFSFRWYASSEISGSNWYDYLTFSIDGVQTNKIGGTSCSWTQCSYTLGAGSHTLRWNYLKDVSQDKGEDAGFVDQVVWTPTPVLPDAPTGVSATDGTYSDKVSISWTGSSGATSYNLYRSTTSTRPSTATKTGVTSPCSDTSATPGTTYYYWVSAVNSAGSSYSSYNTGYRAVSLSVGTTTASFDAAGGTGTATVTANTSWSATADVSWITFTTASGSGNGTVAYTVAASTSTEPRTGTITITAGAGTSHLVTRIITVTQGGVGDESKLPDLSFATFSSWAQHGTCVYVSDVWSNDAVRVCEKGKVFGVNYGFANFGETVADGVITNLVEILDEHMAVLKTEYDHWTIALTQNRGYANNFMLTTQIKNLPVGPYTARVTLDAYNAIRECDENDNTYSYKFAVCDPVSLNEALDNATLTFVTDEESGWFGTKGLGADGVDAAQSAHRGNSSTNSLQTIITGPGTIAFKWKVSSEAGYDELCFLIDGVMRSSRSGTGGDWEERSYELSAGTHVVTWAYCKDSSYYDGGDCGWVDNVVWTGDAPPSDIVISDVVTLPKAEVESFMAKYPSLAAQVGGDAEAFAKLPSATGKLDANGNQIYVWQDIIAGTDPTNPDDKFKIVDIKFEDGELKVSWSPDLNENGTKNIRAYTEFGRKELGGSEKWTEMKDVDPAEKNDYKFRKVTVDMP